MSAFLYMKMHKNAQDLYILTRLIDVTEQLRAKDREYGKYCPFVGI